MCHLLLFKCCYKKANPANLANEGFNRLNSLTTLASQYLKFNIINTY